MPDDVPEMIAAAVRTHFRRERIEEVHEEQYAK